MSEFNTTDPNKIKAKFDSSNKMNPYPHSEAGVEVCCCGSSLAVCAVLVAVMTDEQISHGTNELSILSPIPNYSAAASKIQLPICVLLSSVQENVRSLTKQSDFSDKRLLPATVRRV
jgi:hypothetical protein